MTEKSHEVGRILTRAKDEAIGCSMLGILLEEVYEDHASGALHQCTGMERTVCRKVTPESLLQDGVEGVCGQARDHQGIHML